MTHNFSDDCKKATELLTENKSCVLVKGDSVYTSEKSGIAPLMELIASGENYKGFSASDKIVGKAAAMLFCKLGVTELHAKVMSKHAVEYLLKTDMIFHYGTLTEEIINRKGTGICPMEQTVLYIKDYEKGYQALKNKLDELRNGNK